MPLDTIFSLANLAALLGWAVLLASPLLPRRARVVPRTLVPALLALAYLVLILTSFGEAEGGFSSLAGLAALFAVPEVLLAGWLHFLAFDLFVGSLLVEDRERSGLPFILLVPCLALTFLLGPVGFLLYLALGWSLGRRPLGEGPAR